MLLSHHHSTCALVSEILESVLQTVQKQFTYRRYILTDLHRWARHQIPNCSPGAAAKMAAHCSGCVLTGMFVHFGWNKCRALIPEYRLPYLATCHVTLYIYIYTHTHTYIHIYIYIRDGKIISVHLQKKLTAMHWFKVCIGYKLPFKSRCIISNKFVSVKKDLFIYNY